MSKELIVKKLIPEEEQEGSRLDVFLSETFPEKSRSSLQKLIKEGHVLIDGKAAKSSHAVAQKEEILIEFPEPEALNILPENIPLDIVYEDSDVILVNKPKGMVVHPANGHYSGTMVNALLYHCQDLSGINGVLRPGIVHRIDMDTTGIVIACKNDKAHLSIAEQLKEHSIKRRYYALVHGRFSEEEGTVDKPIGRDIKDRKKMAIRPDGKTAVTHYRVIEQFQDAALIECRLETGRTHQIRVHMTSIGHPLFGDEVYGARKTLYHTQGQTLHAYLLGFVHPSTGEEMVFETPRPEYFEKILKDLRQKNS